MMCPIYCPIYWSPLLKSGNFFMTTANGNTVLNIMMSGLKFSSELALLKLSRMLVIKDFNVICSSPKLSICWRCSISLACLQVGQSFAK